MRFFLVSLVTSLSLSLCRWLLAYFSCLSASFRGDGAGKVVTPGLNMKARTCSKDTVYT